MSYDFFSTSGTLLLASVLLGVGLSLSGCDSTGSNAEGNEEDEETVTVDSPLLYAEVNTDLEGTVYTVQADGSNRSEVADSIDTGIARWADSRSTVVYTRGSTLYRVNPDGTEKEIILDREAGFFQMDASSDQIAFTLDGERGIYVVGLDGTGLAKVVDRRISNVRLSPDGSRILFNDSSSEDQDLFTVPVDGSASPTRLTSGMEAEQFTWSPDGSDVLFRDDSSGNLYRVPADGSSDASQLTDGPASDFSPDWHGSEIVFSSLNRNGENQTLIYKMDADGSDMTQLTEVQESENAAEADRNPVWAPNGEGIAFVSPLRNDSREPNIFVITPAGEGLTPVTETSIPSNVIDW